MHVIQIIRLYLGVSQKELATRACISQPDLCEMETKEPYGQIGKYQKLSDYLGIPIHALVTNDCSLIPASFFDKFPPRPYTEVHVEGNVKRGRSGEDLAFQLETKRLQEKGSILWRLVLPLYKMQQRNGYDILSFDDAGKPIYIEVKVSQDDSNLFRLTKQERQFAEKVTAHGELYQIFRFVNWESKQQELIVHSFEEIQNSWEFSPCTYLCSATVRSANVSGITYWREQRGISKGEFADMLGMKTPDLWRYENGKRGCPVGVYQQMAQILNVNIDHLLLTYPGFIPS